MLSPQIAPPTQIPVMVLDGCNLLPHGMLPLCIFEPRYRQMLADALAGERMFAIGTVDPDGDPDAPEPQVLPDSCAGMIRACVGRPDGTSHLILQGLHRIRFGGWVEDEEDEEGSDSKPYRIARVEQVPTVDENSDASAALAMKAIELATEVINSRKGKDSPPSSNAIQEIKSISNPEAVADLVAYHLIRNPMERQPLLGIQDVSERLRFVISLLSAAGPEFP